jgi:hypothetical protein
MILSIANNNVLPPASMSFAGIPILPKLVKALCYRAGSCWFKIRSSEWLLSIFLILTAAIGPGVYSATNRNEYQNQEYVFL